MDTTIEGEGRECPHCKNKLPITFSHNLKDDESDELISSIKIDK